MGDSSWAFLVGSWEWFLVLLEVNAVRTVFVFRFNGADAWG